MKFLHSGKTSLVSTILNIIGLTFSFAALYIIIVQVHYDFTYNHGIKDNDRIYLLTNNIFDENYYSSNISRPLAEGLISSIPEIEIGGYVVRGKYKSEVAKDLESDFITVTSTDATIEGIKTIGYEETEGNWDNWIPGTSIAITESLAKKLGVHTGDYIKIGTPPETRDYQIAVIYKDFPENTDFALHDIIFNFGDYQINNFSDWNLKYYVKVHEGVSEKELNANVTDYVKKFYSEKQGMAKEKIDREIGNGQFKFFSLSDSYFNPVIKKSGPSGNKTTAFTLLGVAILIVIIAFINYINFFFALVPIKLKDVNTRKILGSSRTNLILNIIRESVVFVLISLGLGAVLVVIFSHSPYSHLISTSVLMNHNWGMVFITIGVGILISLIASIFPSFYITSFNPALAIKGSMGNSTRGESFRNVLIGFQFLISLILIVCAIVINHQRNFMLHHDLGFDNSNLLTTSVTWDLAGKSETVESKLREDVEIADVTWADGPIVDSERMGWSRNLNEEQKVIMDVYPVAWNFLQVMNIPIVEGRDFLKSDEQSENGVFIINETTRDIYGLKIGDKFSGHKNEPAEIVGISKNINYKPLTQEGGAFCFYQFGKEPWGNLWQLYVRTNPGANPYEVKDKIAKILSELDPSVNEESWDIQLFNESLEKFYQKEKNLSQLINLFTLLAIVISLMGVFGMVMFDTEHRKKEIGIRRVNGASVEEILKMFNVKFIKIVIVSFIIAVPLSWWILTLYLQSYPYRTPIYIWVFFVAFLAVLLITTGVVTLRSFRAVTANPVESLRTE